MKSLYDKNFRYTDLARNLEGDVGPLVRSVFSAWVAKGFSPREISHIIQLVVFDAEMTNVLEADIPKQMEKKDET